MFGRIKLGLLCAVLMLITAGCPQSNQTSTTGSGSEMDVRTEVTRDVGSSPLESPFSADGPVITRVDSVEDARRLAPFEFDIPLERPELKFSGGQVVTNLDGDSATEVSLFYRLDSNSEGGEKITFGVSKPSIGTPEPGWSADCDCDPLLIGDIEAAGKDRNVVTGAAGDGSSHIEPTWLYWYAGDLKYGITGWPGLPMAELTEIVKTIDH